MRELETELEMSRPEVTSSTEPIAEVTLAFWVMKVLATTLGETAGDFISMTLNWATSLDWHYVWPVGGRPLLSD
jgi:uncharacterized membrane-anchored protein